jgi:hypothetical protein
LKESGPSHIYFKVEVNTKQLTIEASESETVERFVDTCARKFKKEFFSRMITVLHNDVDFRTVERHSRLDKLNINETSLLHIVNRTTVPTGASTGSFNFTVLRLTGARIELNGVPGDW